MKIIPGTIHPQAGKRPKTFVQVRLRDLVSEFAHNGRRGDIHPDPENRGGTAKGMAVINMDHVAKIMAAFDPDARDGITLAQQEDGETYIVTDGHHFLVAALLLQEAGRLAPAHAEGMVKVRVVPEVDREYWHQKLNNQLRYGAGAKIRRKGNPLHQRLDPAFRPLASRLGVKGTKGLIGRLGQIVADFLVLHGAANVDTDALKDARRETNVLLDQTDLDAIPSVPRAVKNGLSFFAEVGHELNERFPKGKAPKGISANAGIMTLLLTDSTNGCTITGKYTPRKIAGALAAPKGRAKNLTHRDVELAANTISRRNMGETRAYATLLYMGVEKTDAWDFVQAHFPREAERVLGSKIEARDLP